MSIFPHEKFVLRRKGRENVQVEGVFSIYGDGRLSPTDKSYNDQKRTQARLYTTSKSIPTEGVLGAIFTHEGVTYQVVEERLYKFSPLEEDIALVCEAS